MKQLFVLILFFAANQNGIAQVILEADGPGSTYELINSVLAPGFDVVEAPDCSHNSFPRHIDEIFDTTLNKFVFQFHIHTMPDNDRCINFDRQRNEIKTYDKSPDNLKATFQEKVRYKWKFKLDSGFQPSSKFTHIHQIKAVGGSESSMPIITLTPRKNNPDKMQLRYAANSSQSTIYEVDLAPFKGVWVEAEETIIYDEVGLGSYEIRIKKVSDGTEIFYYVNNAIRMWKTDADFLRPKWGIYRSLDDASSLRDEMVLFADFSIEELDPTSSLRNQNLEITPILVYPNPAKDELLLSEIALNTYDSIHIFNLNGELVLTEKIASEKISIADLSAGIYLIKLKTVNLKTKIVKIIVE